MNRLTAIVLTIAVALAATLLLATCDQTGKRVTVRYKFQPGMKMTYQQVTRGLVKERDMTLDTLTHDALAEETMDIEYYVRRLLDDSTAEIVESITWKSKSENRLDSSTYDTVLKEPQKSPQIIKYMKPNGRIVDMEYVSDTVRGKMEYLKEYYKQGFPVFPEGGIGQGHTWSQTTTVVLPDGPMEASTTYTIKSFARERGYDCVVIEYDGVSIIPLPVCRSEEEYDILGGVDNITSKGHMYFAYKEGIVVLLRERWILDSDRTIVRKKAHTLFNYEPGDTVDINIAIEYDVDYHLTGLEMP